MDDTPELQTLRRYEAELVKAEQAAQLAIQRRESLRQVVEGLRDLMTPERAILRDRKRRALTDPLTARVHRLWEDATEERPKRAPETTNNGKVPRGREAVRRVLIETRDSWRVPALAEEIGRRGWMPGVKGRKEAVSATIQRLVADGEVERVEHGLYRYALDKLPPVTEEPG